MTYVRPVSCTATAQEQYQIFKFKNRYERVRFIYRIYLATQQILNVCGRDPSCSGDRCFYIAGIPVDGNPVAAWAGESWRGDEAGDGLGWE